MNKISTFNELLEWKKRYFDELKLKSNSENTFKTYQRALNEFFSFLEFGLGENGLDELRWEDFNKFLFNAFLQNLKIRLNEKSVNLYMRIVKNFLKYIAEHNEEGIDPYYKIENVKPLKEPVEEITVFEEDELEKIDRTLFRLLDKTKEYSKYKNLLCILFIRYTGMRADECLSLQIKDINIQEDGIKLIVTGKGNKQRPLYLDIAFLPYIKKMLDLREKHNIKSQYFFATKNDKKSTIQGLYRANKKLLKEAGIKDKNKIGLHTYRHTFASLLVTEDVNMETIKEILGHSNILTTSRYYARTNEKAKKKSMLKIQKR